MNVRHATPTELEEVDTKLIYEKDELYSAVEVHMIGFVSMRKLDCEDCTLCVVQKYDGSIILATDEQLFVRID